VPWKDLRAYGPSVVGWNGGRLDRVPTGVSIRASWNGKVLAESDRTVSLEGNRYFPIESLDRELVVDSDRHTRCPWKGRASYFDIVVDGAVNPGAAWYYPKPWPLARKIKDHLAFWNGVAVEEIAGGTGDSGGPAASL